MTGKVIPKQVLRHFTAPPDDTLQRIVLEHRVTESVAAALTPLFVMREQRLCKAFLAWQYEGTPECREAREAAQERARIALNRRYGRRR